jgi:hypothetical protein
MENVVLTNAQKSDLCAIAAMMIPMSDEYDVPGADDPLIQADIIASLGLDMPAVKAALDQLARLAGKRLILLTPAQQTDLRKTFKTTGGASAATLIRVVLQAYYRDDRVVRSLGQELRAPFPLGYSLAQGDWSLLDAVKARPSILRPVS